MPLHFIRHDITKVKTDAIVLPANNQLKINLGRDTDTTGAVTGGLAGILYGLDSEFARDCMDQLRNKELIEECLWEEKDPTLHFRGEKCCSFSNRTNSC